MILLFPGSLYTLPFFGQLSVVGPLREVLVKPLLISLVQLKTHFASRKKPFYEQSFNRLHINTLVMDNPALDGPYRYRVSAALQ